MNLNPTIINTINLSVTIEQGEFYQAVSLVSRAIAKHNVQPVLSNILLKASSEKQNLQIIATDLDLGLAASIPAQIEVEGEITVPAQKLVDILSKLPATKIILQSSEKGLINIKCGRSKFEIKGLSAEQFPQDFVQQAYQIQDKNGS